MSTESEIQYENTVKQIVGKLLISEERLACEHIAAGKAPWSQRAQALLALDEGQSEEVAAERSGLRVTQVSYWINAFRKQRTDIFPENILKDDKKVLAVPNAEIPEEEAPSSKSAGKIKKSKKTKKSKKSKNKKKKASKKKKSKNSKAKKSKKKGKKKKKKKSR